MSKKSFYVLITALYALSIVWLLLHFSDAARPHLPQCPFRSVTHIPCPACGSTTGVLHIIHGEIVPAAKSNILSFPVLLLLIILPFSLLYDLVTRRFTTYQRYCRAEELLRKPGLAIPFTLIIVIIWLTNIIRSL